MIEYSRHVARHEVAGEFKIFESLGWQREVNPQHGMRMSFPEKQHRVSRLEIEQAVRHLTMGWLEQAWTESVTQ